MSNLAKAIEELTAAVKENTAALRGKPPAVVPSAAAARAAFEEAAEQSAIKEQPQGSKPEDCVSGALTYERDVKPWAIKLSAKDKPAFMDLLAERSVKKGSDIPVEHLPEFLGRIKRVLGE